MKIRYGSVCSGVEAASLAWNPLGWEPVFFSEIEPFPCAVLNQRFGAGRPIHMLEPEEIQIDPAEWDLIQAAKKDKNIKIDYDLLSRYKEYSQRLSWKKQNMKLPEIGTVPNEGDFTKIGKKYYGKIDLLVGGTPCQDLSVAGKRAGFDGERSSLALDFVRLAYESGCKWFVWENVPGVFSSNKGRDFATLLSLFTGSEITPPEKGFANSGFICNARRDRYGVAWRVLDAQFTRTYGFPFAVPQRRRRVFLIGYFGDWTRPARILLECNRLQWNTPARIRTREIFAGNTGICLENSSWNYQTQAGSAKLVDVSCTGGKKNITACETGKGFFKEQECAQTIEAHEDQHRRNIIYSAIWKYNESANLALIFSIEPLSSNSMKSKNPNSGFHGTEVKKRLDTSDQNTSKNQGGQEMVETSVICRATQQGNAESMENCAPALTAASGMSGNNQPIICAAFMHRAGAKAGSIGYEKEVAPTCRAEMEPSVLCVHGSQDPICNDNHANAIGRNSGQENVVWVLNDQGGSVMNIEASGIAGTLRANTHGNEQIICYAEESHADNRPVKEVCISPALVARIGTGGNNLPIIQTYYPNQHQNPQISETVTLTCGNCNTVRGDTPLVQEINCCYENHAQDSRIKELDGVCSQISAKAGTGGNNLPLVLSVYAGNRHTAGNHAVAIAENIIGRKINTGGNGTGAQEELAYTQNCSGVMGVATETEESATVRRLMPVECERLMGFPDGHTLIEWNGKETDDCPDAPRYKACGNSMCVNCMHWIGERIDKIEQEGSKNE